MKRSERWPFIWQIVKVNLRHNFLPLLGLAAVTVLLIPIIFGVRELDAKTAAAPLEMLLSTLGIVFIVPLFLPEQNPDIEDVVASKSIDITCIHFIRAVYSIGMLAICVVLFSAFLLFNGCEITPSLVFGTIADALFLGGIGLLAAAVANNLTVALMPPVIYYLTSMVMQKKMGVFNLFGMMRGNHAPNIWLFVTGLLLISAALWVKRMILKRR